jgi:hypothetical protein
MQYFKLKSTFMTHFKFLLLIIFAFTFVNVDAQTMDKKTRKVTIFTPDEKDNLQMWFHEEVNKMKFTEEELDDYYAVIFYYISKISRLDDLDKGYTKEEFNQELNKLLAKQNADLQEMLTAERFTLHTEIFNVFLEAAYVRWGIDE